MATEAAPQGDFLISPCSDCGEPTIGGADRCPHCILCPAGSDCAEDPCPAVTGDEARCPHGYALRLVCPTCHGKRAYLIAYAKTRNIVGRLGRTDAEIEEAVDIVMGLDYG